MQLDDTDRLLDVKIWKFDVTWPSQKGHYRVGIGLCQNGRINKTIVGGYGVEPSAGPRRSHVTIGLVPIAGTFFDAKQLKYILSTGGGSGTGTIPNPFVHSHGYTQNAEVVSPQNLAILMSGNLKKSWVNSPASFNETAIVLELTENMPSK